MVILSKKKFLVPYCLLYMLTSYVLTSDSPIPYRSQWVECTQEVPADYFGNTLSIDHECMSRYFVKIGASVLAEPLIQKALEKEGLDPSPISFKYKEKYSSLFTTPQPAITCGPHFFQQTYEWGLSRDEAEKNLKTVLRHEIGHVVNGDVDASRALLYGIDDPQVQKFLMRHPEKTDEFVALSNKSLDFEEFATRGQESAADVFAIRHTEDQQELEAAAKAFRAIAAENNCAPSSRYRLPGDRARLLSSIAAIRVAKPLNIFEQLKRRLGL